jgi:hypothetical protein
MNGNSLPLLNIMDFQRGCWIGRLVHWRRFGLQRNATPPEAVQKEWSGFFERGSRILSNRRRRAILLLF